MSKTINILFFFISINFYFSQTLSSSLNKNKIDLGEVITMKINVQNLQGKEIISAQKNGLLPFSFEEYKDDINQDRDQYTRIIEFTIFTEGMHQIPALEFKIGDSIHHTIPYEIEVINTAKKDDEINDIMPNQEVKLGATEYWDLYGMYVIISLVILALILAFVLWRKRDNPQKDIPIKNVKNEILKEISLLENKNYIENGEYRLFYIELLDICRKFLTKKYLIPADILLTDDLIDLMNKSTTISKKHQEIFYEIFKRGDLVKFAKTIPNQDIMEQDLRYIKDIISD